MSSATWFLNPSNFVCTEGDVLFAFSCVCLCFFLCIWGLFGFLLCVCCVFFGGGGGRLVLKLACVLLMN